MSSVLKIYSPEDCDFYYDGELQGHIEGNSDRAFRFEVERKGANLLKFVNSEYKSELIVKVSIDADEEREVELDFSEVNEPAIQERERIIIAIEHDYELGEQLPEEILSVISKNGIVTIPKGVRKIGWAAFMGCSLTSITIPNSVTEIGCFAFCDCISLTSITIPNSVTKIGDFAFEGCSLTSITIPNSVTEIGEFAFLASSLTSITIPNSVTEIGNYAFMGCSSLTSITIPNSVTEIGCSAFSGCSRLTEFISEYASYDRRCLIKDGRMLAFAPYDITKYTIPNSVTKIGSSAFSDCSSLTSITIPNSVTEIGHSAFSGCSRLTEFFSEYASYDRRCLIKDGRMLAFAPNDITKYTIPNSVTEIGDYAFMGCSSLTSITIPNSVTEIGCWAFRDCRSLTSVYCKATNPPRIYPTFDPFRNTASDLKIYVPKSEGLTVLEAYKSAEGWKDYADIIEEYDFDNE